MKVKMTFALFTMLGHAALAGRLEKTVAAKGSSAPQTGGLTTIGEDEFSEDDFRRLQAIEKAARAGEADLQDAYTEATAKIAADIAQLNTELAALDKENVAKQGSLTFADYNNTWKPRYDADRAALQGKVAAQNTLTKQEQSQRDSHVRAIQAQRASDVAAAKLEAMRNVSRNKPERALQVLEALYHQKRTRDSGKVAKMGGATALGALGGAAIAGAVGFVGGECLGQCGYAAIHCDVPGTEAGQNAAGLACGEQAAAAGGIVGGLGGAGYGLSNACASDLGNRGYTADEQALIDLMCANEDVAQTFKKW